MQNANDAAAQQNTSEPKRGGLWAAITAGVTMLIAGFAAFAGGAISQESLLQLIQDAGPSTAFIVVGAGVTQAILKQQHASMVQQERREEREHARYNREQAMEEQRFMAQQLRDESLATALNELTGTQRGLAEFLQRDREAAAKRNDQLVSAITHQTDSITKLETTESAKHQLTHDQIRALAKQMPDMNRIGDLLDTMQAIAQRIDKTHEQIASSFETGTRVYQSVENIVTEWDKTSQSLVSILLKLLDKLPTHTEDKSDGKHNNSGDAVA